MISVLFLVEMTRIRDTWKKISDPGPTGKKTDTILNKSRSDLKPTSDKKIYSNYYHFGRKILKEKFDFGGFLILVFH